jgi:hypothetical protein
MEYDERIGNVLVEARAGRRMSFFAVSGRRLGISHNLPLAHCRCSYEMGTIRLLTNKGKYGLKALVHLAGLAEGETAQAIEIATTNHIPKKFLDAILRDLKIAGLVAAKKGRRLPARPSRGRHHRRQGNPRS